MESSARTAAKTAYLAFTDPASLDSSVAFVVHLLDTLHRSPAIQANHRRVAALLGVREGSKILDVGCGTGNFARDLAVLVGSTGSVTGVDLSEALLGIANTRTADAGLPISYHLGDATSLPFPDRSFDGARTERVLQYLSDPITAILEMKRVTRPGGRVVATELDWDGIAFDCVDIDRDVWRRAVHSICDGVGNGWQGRQLRRLFVDAGLEQVTCEGFINTNPDDSDPNTRMDFGPTIAKAADAGAISADEATQLVDKMLELARTGRLTMGFPFYTVAGMVP